MPQSDARSVYSQRLSALESERSRLRRRDRLFGFSKLAFAAIAVVSALALARAYPALLAWALAPALVFVVLWIAHERLLRTLGKSTRLEEFYRRGLARLDDKWAGHGDSGQRFLDPKHLYARDLDIFGAGSLYELISQAASAPGQHTLADWLLQPAEPNEIAQRQDAIRELATAPRSARTAWHSRPMPFTRARRKRSRSGPNRVKHRARLAALRCASARAALAQQHVLLVRHQQLHLVRAPQLRQCRAHDALHRSRQTRGGGRAPDITLARLAASRARGL